MTAAISTTSEVLASVRTLAEIKEDVYAIANKYSARAVDSTVKLKDWCNRNLSILPADFNLRARKTWENLKTLVERYDYQQEQEKRQDAALAEWCESLETTWEEIDAETEALAADPVADMIEELYAVEPPSALQLARTERRAAIGRKSAIALSRRLAKFGL